MSEHIPFPYVQQENQDYIYFFWIQAGIIAPTKAAAKYHSYRVYLTIQQWLQNELSPFEWGWIYNDNILVPIETDRPVVPDSVLDLIACGCKTGCLKSCGCRKVRVCCSPMCSHCNGQTCWNIHSIVTDGDEENSFSQVFTVECFLKKTIMYVITVAM